MAAAATAAAADTNSERRQRPRPRVMGGDVLFNRRIRSDVDSARTSRPGMRYSKRAKLVSFPETESTPNASQHHLH
jgi:hypothetical protein